TRRSAAGPAGGLPGGRPSSRFRPAACAADSPDTDPAGRRKLPADLDPPPPAAGRLVGAAAVQRGAGALRQRGTETAHATGRAPAIPRLYRLATTAGAGA